MKEDESVETIFFRIQTLLFRLKVLNKSYTTTYHVMKTLRSLPKKWESKVFVIQKANDLITLALENIISSFHSHDIDLYEDKNQKKPNYIYCKI